VQCNTVTDFDSVISPYRSIQSMFRRLALASIGATGIGAVFVAYKYRPRKNDDKKFFEKYVRFTLNPADL